MPAPSLLAGLYNLQMPPKHQNALVYSADTVLLSDISYRSFTYPGDEEALKALKSVPGAGALLTWLEANFTEQITYLNNNEQMIRVSANNYTSLHALVARCCEVLSCPVPDIYITTNPVMNAYTSGQRRACIVLHSTLVESLTADELCFVVGHELGHIMASHGLYRQLGDILIGYWELLSSLVPIPGLSLLRIPLLLAYWEWYRRSEFTCDRAGLLCVQNLDPGLRALTKLAGKIDGYEDEVNVDATINQLESHKEVNKLVLLVSIFENSANTHPFVPARLKALKEFVASEQYQQILAGNYARKLQLPAEGAEPLKLETEAVPEAAPEASPVGGTAVTESVGKWKNAAVGLFNKTKS